MVSRKGFLKTSLGAGVGASCAFALGAEATPEDPITPCPEKLEFARDWLVRFVDTLDVSVEESRRVGVLESRGRSCARSGAIELARKHSGNVDAFVAELQTWLGKDGIRREGSTIHVTYGRCLCPLGSGAKGRVSASFCHCSVGWLKEMYETVSGGAVSVEAHETILRGGAACRFSVYLEEV
jgi:hypothetical protein